MQKLITLEPMRKILSFILICISLVVYSQAPNRFAEGDEQSLMSKSTPENSGEYPTQQYENPNAAPAEIKASDDPGNPGDVVPIDDYIPLLLIAAMGLIVYNTYRKKTLS